MDETILSGDVNISILFFIHNLRRYCNENRTVILDNLKEGIWLVPQKSLSFLKFVQVNIKFDIICWFKSIDGHFTYQIKKSLWK
jgi:hypothetical protein